MNRRGFLKLAGSGLLVAAAPAVALAGDETEPVRRYWQVPRSAPVGDGRAFAGADYGIRHLESTVYVARSNAIGTIAAFVSNDGVEWESLYPPFPKPEALRRAGKSVAARVALIDDLIERGCIKAPLDTRLTVATVHAVHIPRALDRQTRGADV